MVNIDLLKAALNNLNSEMSNSNQCLDDTALTMLTNAWVNYGLENVIFLDGEYYIFTDKIGVYIDFEDLVKEVEVFVPNIKYAMYQQLIFALIGISFIYLPLCKNC